MSEIVVQTGQSKLPVHAKVIARIIALNCYSFLSVFYQKFYTKKYFTNVYRGEF